ncbi:hypothetical protein bcere0016_43280 [Bacillus cereus 95/8201]|uniref:type II toxin-antitoxin system VapC family toxin n=1 Tax=Bacillus cereus group TaxID=86661 RepID=UPI0001A09351|nr:MULTISPECIES: type II toxin-antitoxin system VapC family toxin [Bacillus cereus group]AJH63793.1 hypothetical protein BG11_4717 [Bacillus cereus]AJK34410.1 hypothetical protein BF33_5303 [Bacillus cereus]EEL14993.1 hypothetical protein bcere0016_43280 [Bacillus cereus 95/8201]KWU69016.1 hypothetical protein AWW71_27930 [Bacillus cereus]MDA2587719.1 type II toxin-antitoxin system VapC family toxin [Bacillus cereus group sp. Bc062]
MTSYLIDTNIIRYYVENKYDIETFFEQCERNNDSIYISSIVLGEIKAQRFELNKEQNISRRDLCDGFFPVSIEKTDIMALHLRGFVRWLQQHHKAIRHPVNIVIPALSDAMIAIHAIKSGLTLVTHNVKDFSVVRFFGITIYDPVTNIYYGPIKKDRTKRGYYWDLPNPYY